MKKACVAAILVAAVFACPVSAQDEKPRSEGSERPKKLPTKKTAAITTNDEAEAKRKADKESEEIGKAAGVFLGMSLAVVIVAGVISFLAQITPIFIAWSRGHPNKVAITVLCLLSSWTCIGWVVSLVWSLTAFEKPTRQLRRGQSGDDFNFE